ncbi:hypothetical protein NITGR_160002 [Nitrospina gracilis 3/211]|uniref:IrrE N-terminal-like domain-containing protein n=1 Tax=Nitrospina gracilis (strain 3/211) TaxID=1266370 RepID=M1YWP1_NITG3|nr:MULTISPECIES: ImmA/IrrE family metallo-endopeptidase [Nitrospina]MCF8722746.1 Zn-dependent peptidase ImmA (M78 family) [Nitrospina sp. Nb-3]CCQ89693.1 hypothetical protein NITGR_160002 [Nitrospina gracilis 3/211]
MPIVFLPPPVIEKKALEFVEGLRLENTIPVPIDDIVEIKLDIRIIPSPDLIKTGIDAFSTRDFKEIYIDGKQFSERERRARFTLAHEIGHFVLHKDFVQQEHFGSLEEWKEFVLNDRQRDWLETQANMFAAFLLLPTKHLAKEFERAKDDLSKNPEFSKHGSLPADELLAPYLAKGISNIFEVSEETASNRISNWLEIKSR